MRGILTLPILSGLLVVQPAPELVVSVGHAGAPSHAAFVGSYLATAEWSNVGLIDLESGLTVAHLPQGSLVMAIEASPSGEILAVGSCDHRIQLWDVRSRRVVRRLSLEQECAESVSFSPDGALLAMGGYGCCSGKGLQVWDVRTGELARVLAGEAKIRHVVFGGNGLWVAGIDDGGRASLFEWPSGRELRTIAGFVDSGSPEAGVITSPDGAYFGWFGFESGVRVWDVVSGEEVPPIGRRAREGRGRWSGSLITTAAFLDDGRLACVNDEDEMVAMRLPKGPREKRRLAKRETEFFGDVGVVQPQSWIRIREDGAVIAGSRDTRTVVWDVARARLFEPTAPALVYPSSLSWSRSGIVAWTDVQSGAQGWDDRSAQHVRFGDADSIAFRPDGRQFAVGGYSSMTIFDVASHRPVASSSSVSSTGTAVAFSPDGSRLAFASPVRGFDLFDANLRFRQPSPCSRNLQRSNREHSAPMAGRSPPASAAPSIAARLAGGRGGVGPRGHARL